MWFLAMGCFALWVAGSFMLWLETRGWSTMWAVFTVVPCGGFLYAIFRQMKNKLKNTKVGESGKNNIKN